MSKDEFILKINKVKVDLSNIRAGIKKEDIKDVKMQTIFDAIDTTDDDVLSESEINTFFGLVKEEAQKHYSKNLGNREYKKLLKKLEENGIEIKDVDKATFLQFLSELKDASDKPVEVQDVSEQEEQQISEQQREEEKDREGNSVTDKTTTVVVQLNETPEMLAKKFGCTAEEIRELNKDKLINDGKWLRAGDKIVIPKEIAPEQLEGRKTSEEVNEQYRQAMANKRAKKATPADKDNTNAAKKAAKVNNGDEEGDDIIAQDPDGAEGAEHKVSVAVPEATNSSWVKNILKYQEAGVKLTESLKKNNLNGLNRSNLPYAFTEDVKIEDLSEKTIHFIFANLVQRMKDFKLFRQGKDYGFYDTFKKLSKASQNKILREYNERILKYEDKAIMNDIARIKKENAERPKVQKIFNEANKLLNDTANGKIKPKEIENSYRNGDIVTKTAKLNDGRKIRVHYDDGEIMQVDICNSTTDNPTVEYLNNFAGIDTNTSNNVIEKTIESGYDFEKIKAAAEAIFGKYEAPEAANEAEDAAADEGEDAAGPQTTEGSDAPETNPKFTTEQIKTTVHFTRYSETQIKRDMKEGLSIATGEKGIETLNRRNVAYAIVHGDKYAGTKNAELIFNNLVKRMVNLDIFEKGKDYGTYASLSKLPLAKQDAIIHAYALRIRNKDTEHLNAPKEADKQQKVFDEANKFLVDMANDKKHLGANKWLNNEKNILCAYLPEPDGRGIEAKLDKDGKIKSVGIVYHTNLNQFDVKYYDSYAYVDTDKNNDKFEGKIESGYNFSELKKVAEAIFAEFLNKQN